MTTDAGPSDPAGTVGDGHLCHKDIGYFVTVKSLKTNRFKNSVVPYGLYNWQ